MSKTTQRQEQTPRAWPPRLRTKTGCVTCRQRRKKCDERRPACGDCFRFKRACLWSTELTDGRHGSRKSSSPLGNAPSSVASPTSEPGKQCLADEYASQSLSTLSLGSRSPFSSTNASSTPWYDQITWHHNRLTSRRERMLFHHFFTICMPLAIRFQARPTYGKYEDVYQIGFQLPNVMNVFIGIAAVHSAGQDKEAALVATKLYNSSVNSVWNQIKYHEVDGTEEWLFVLTVFMCLFEVYRFDIQYEVMVHLEGLAQIFKARKANSMMPNPERPFHRIAAEAFTYHLAITSILNSKSRIDRVANQFIWSDLNGYESTVPFPNASKVANSPILGSSIQLFQIIFGITRLSRRTPLQSYEHSEASKYKTQICEFQQRMTGRNLFTGEADDIWEPYNGVLLYALAAKLFLFKVMHPDATSAHPVIQELVHQSLQLLPCCRASLGPSSFYCWPLTILACAVSHKEETVVIREKLEELWTASKSGHIHRTIHVVEAIWENQGLGSTVITIGMPVNGLDRLLYQDGLIALLQLTKTIDVQ